MRRLVLIAAILAAMVVPVPQAALAQSGSATIEPSQTAGVTSETPTDGTPPFGATYLPFGNYIRATRRRRPSSAGHWC